MRALLLLLALATLLPGCVMSPPAAEVPSPSSDAAPASPLSSGASTTSLGLNLVAQGDAPGGYALRVHEDRAYIATFTTLEGISVFNVSDPLNPVHLGGTPPGTLARSVDILDYGTRVAVALSTGTELEVWELTDPADPVLLKSFAFGSHNVQVHPETKTIYNARNLWDGVGGAMEIVNASDPDNILLDNVWTFPTFAADGTHVHNQGCHDLTIWPDQDRAYCAAYEQTLVFDVSDPLHPTILTAITNPAIMSHHTAFPILNHTVLVISDEWADNTMWGCVAHGVDGLPEAPISALWFYDLTTPTPELISYLATPPMAPEVWFIEHGINAMCTSHNGEELGENTGLIAYGWFRAGILLIDASDPTAPAILDHQDPGGAYGDARWYDGYVFAADDQIGLTVFEVS